MKKRTLFTTLFSLTAAVCCVFGLAACEDKETTVPVAQVSLSEATLTLKEGESATLTATVLPENATDKSVSWDSSDDAIATVADGTVTAVKEGEATITVTTKDGGKTATCEVTVTPDGEKPDDGKPDDDKPDPVVELGSAKENPFLVTLGDEAAKSGQLSTDKTYWFKLTLTEDTKVKFSYGFVTGIENAYVEDGSFALIGANDEPIKNGTAYDQAFAAFEEELQAGDYYFTVSAGGSENARYTVTFEKVVEVVLPGSSKDVAVEAALDEPKEVTFNSGFEYWYVVTPQTDVIVKTTVERTNTTNSTLTYTLYKGEEELATETANYYGASTLTVQKNFEANATYYLKVESSSSNTVTVTFETVEIGSAKDVAKAIAFGAADQLTLNAGQAFWYVFEVTEPATVTAALGEGADGVTLALDNAEDNSATYLTAGTYYLKLTGGTAEATFTVTLTCVTLAEMPEGSIRDKAFEVTVSTTDSASKEFNDSDEHWFKFTLDKARTVTINSTRDDIDKYIEINYALYREDGETAIAETPASYEDGNFTTTQDLAAGTYYLKVTRKAGLAAYTVHFRAAPDGSSLAEAVAASVGKSYEVNAAEYWFALKASADGDAVVYSTGDFDTAVQMYWASGRDSGFGDNDSGEDSNFSLTRPVVSGVTYYFKVTATGENPAFTVYFANPGSSKETALPATVGQTYSGSVSSSAYWLALTPDKDMELKVTVSGSNYTYTVYSNVFDYTQETSRIGGGNGYASYAGFNYSVQLTAGKTYYIMFSVPSGSVSFNAKLEEVAQTPSGGGEGETVEIPTDAVQLSIPSRGNALPASGEGWFKLVVSDSWFYVWSTDGAGDFIQKSAITYNIYDSQGNLVATNDSSVLGKYLDGTYYLKVTFTGTNGCNLNVAYADPLE